MLTDAEATNIVMVSLKVAKESDVTRNVLYKVAKKLNVKVRPGIDRKELLGPVAQHLIEKKYVLLKSKTICRENILLKKELPS